MANTSAPFGFRQYRGTGSAPTYEQNTALISSAYSTPIFFGDAVIPINTGYIQQATAGSVALAGIFVGCKYVSTAQKRTVWSNYWPGSDANGDVTAYIVNDPNAQFVAQSGASGIPASKVGQYAQLVATAGSTASGISAMSLNDSLATTATYPFRVMGVITDPPGSNGSDATSAYNYVIVGFNNVLTRSNGALTGI